MFALILTALTMSMLHDFSANILQTFCKYKVRILDGWEVNFATKIQKIYEIKKAVNLFYCLFLQT
jgi:hypothetical protein